MKKVPTATCVHLGFVCKQKKTMHTFSSDNKIKNNNNKPEINTLSLEDVLND